MILLQSHTEYNRLAEYDPHTGQYTEVLRHAHTSVTSGFYSFLSRVFAAIYGWNGEVFLHIAETRTRIDTSVSAQIPQLGVLVIRKDSAVLHRLHYTPEAMPPDDPTSFIDAEDFDFGLLLARMIQSPERQKVLIQETY